MNNHLEISLLGRVDIKQSGKSVRGLSTRKAGALLIYLACTGQSQPRDVLAELLWPERPRAQARHNLRTDLARLRQALSPYIGSVHQQLVFNRDEPHWLDVAELERRLAAVHPTAPLNEAQASALAEALNLYRGDFLAGFHLPDAPDFEVWITLERERLHRLAIEGLHQLVAYYLDTAQYKVGLTWARRLLALDEFDEAAHSQMMRLLYLNGQRGAALSHYDSYKQSLAAEMGVEPGVEIRALYEQIKNGDSGRRAGEKSGSPDAEPKAPMGPSAQHNLPTFTAPFIGRESDLAQLQAYLNQPACRLVTLMGLGGKGKTWLALQAAWTALSIFPDGVYFVPLVGVTGPGDTSEAEIEALRQRLIVAIVGALELELTGQMAPLAELSRYVRDKQLLLVLDNFEHVLAAATVVSDLLQAAPGLKVLATSREKLRLLGEWTLTLQGLDYPPTPLLQPDWGCSEPPPPPETEWQTQAGMQKLATFSAVQLLTQRARQVRPDFSLTPANSSGIARLCQLVEGLPLGIELAAAQLGAFSSAEIVTAIESNLGRLNAELQNLSPRHRSIRAVFEYSWSRLTLAEQQSLAQLSVFLGGFSVVAAETVAGADWECLLALVNKSLVRFGQTRRYELHELLRQFAAEKLASLTPNLSEGSRDRHCAYYLGLMVQHTPDLEDQRMHQTLNKLRPEMDNLRQAWQWALMRAHFELLKNSLTAIQQFYLRLGFIREGETRFQQAVERVEAQPTEGLARSILLGQLVLARMAFLFPLLRYDQIIELAQIVLEWGQQADDAELVASALEQWGHSLFLQGRYAAAQYQLEQAQIQAQVAGLRLLEAQILGRLGKTWIYRGETAPAHHCYEQALTLYRQLGHQRGEMSVLHDLGELYYEQGDYEQSKTCVEQELSFHRERGAPADLSAALNNLGDIYLRLGMYAKAKQYSTESLQVADRLESPYDACFALDNLASVAHYQDDDAGALSYFSRALAIAETGAQRIQGYILTHLGQILLARGELSRAAEVCQQAVALRQSLGQTHFAMESRAGLAKVRLVQGNLVQAQAEVSEILAYLETAHSLERIEEPALVYLICYEVLTAAQDQRAEELRQAARCLVQMRAAKIKDEALRCSYLENVPFHRVLAIEPSEF